MSSTLYRCRWQAGSWQRRVRVKGRRCTGRGSFSCICLPPTDAARQRYVLAACFIEALETRLAGNIVCRLLLALLFPYIRFLSMETFPIAVPNNSVSTYGHCGRGRWIIWTLKGAHVQRWMPWLSSCAGVCPSMLAPL